MTLGSGAAAGTRRPEVAEGTLTRRLPVAARTVLLVAALSAAGLYFHASSRAYRALRLADDVTATNLQAASRLEPSNAEFRYRIGRYALVAQDFRTAIDSLKTAIALNPYDARPWLDLASAYLATDDLAGAQQALVRALEADPTTPEVVWQTANYELVRGDTAQALRRFHELAENHPESLPDVLNVCWRATKDPALITEKVLPARPEAYFTFIRFLRNKRPADAPFKVWSHLIALKQPFPVQVAFPYFDDLINQGEFEQLAEAWARLPMLDPELRAYIPSEDKIVNGSFELELLNGGLDWRYAARPGASVVIDVTRAHSGRRSLAITFEGAPDDSGVVQLVPVAGNTRYQFSAYMMAENLETISPPRFAILGLRSNKQYLLTDGVRDSAGWQELQGEFTTGPEGDLLLIHIARVPGQRLIRGKVWVDDVQLVSKTGALP